MLPLKVLGFGLTFDSRLERIHESIHLNWFIRPERNELNALWCWLLPLRPPPNTQSAVMCAKAHQSTDSGSERRSSPSPHSYETVLGVDVIACSLPLLRQHPPFSIRTLVGSVMVQAASCSTMVSAQWFSIDNSDFNPSLFVSSTFFFFISFWFVFTVFFKSVAYRDVLNRTGLSPDRDRRTDSWHGMVSRSFGRWEMLMREPEGWGDEYWSLWRLMKSMSLWQRKIKDQSRASVRTRTISKRQDFSGVYRIWACERTSIHVFPASLAVLHHMSCFQWRQAFVKYELIESGVTS